MDEHGVPWSSSECVERTHFGREAEEETWRKQVFLGARASISPDADHWPAAHREASGVQALDNHLLEA